MISYADNVCISKLGIVVRLLLNTIYSTVNKPQFARDKAPYMWKQFVDTLDDSGKIILLGLYVLVVFLIVLGISILWCPFRFVLVLYDADLLPMWRSKDIYRPTRNFSLLPIHNNAFY